MRRLLHCVIGACGEPYRDMVSLRFLFIGLVFSYLKMPRNTNSKNTRK